MKSAVVRFHHIGNFKCLWEVIAVLSFVRSGFVFSYEMTCTIEAMPFKSFKIQEFFLRLKFAY